MPAKTPRRKKTLGTPKPFSLGTQLIAGARKRSEEQYPRNAVVFSQGDPATDVFYIQRGGIKLSVLSGTGKEAVVAMIGAGDFFGEGCLAGQPLRMGSAMAMVPTTVHRFPKSEMQRMLHDEPEFSDHFITHVVARSIRVEEDLIDQLFNSSEKRLARTLLLLARYGRDEAPAGVLPRISQETLAEMIGSTRSRVNYFMNKFRKLGLIEYNGTLKIHASLLSVVLHE